MRVLVTAAVLAVTISAISAASSHAAYSGTPLHITRLDAIGDTFKSGTKQPGHGYVDIRSVRLSRPDPWTLRVVVETVAPLRVESYVTFRYVAPTEEDEVELTALRGRGSLFIYVGDTTNHTRHTRDQKPVASLNGNRITLNLDYGMANDVYFLKPYRHFRWMVRVARDDGFSDTVPDSRQGADRLASFP